MRHVIIIAPIKWREALNNFARSWDSDTGGDRTFDGPGLNSTGTGEPTYIYAIMPTTDKVYQKIHSTLARFPDVELIDADHDTSASIFNARLKELGLQHVREPLPWEAL